MSHSFILQPGRWIGTGTISFSASPEHIPFRTCWTIDTPENGVICCRQFVEMDLLDENVNHFTFHSFHDGNFKVTLENQLFGTIQGRGIVDHPALAWEFHERGGMQGFELYELQENGDYTLHAEYYAEEFFRTIIDGRIWRKEV